MIGAVNTLLAFALFVCTGMIYACIKFLQEWATPLTVVNYILLAAIKKGASDIHVEPYEKMFRVRFRIDGVLNTVYELPAQVCAAVTSRIKILGRMDVAEKRRPQDGRLKTRSPGGDEIELRLSTLPTAFGGIPAFAIVAVAMISAPRTADSRSSATAAPVAWEKAWAPAGERFQTVNSAFGNAAE